MSSNTPPKRDYRQEVTDNIIDMLEKGTSPWQKPWRAGALEMPFNPTSDRAYRGGNAMNLMAVGMARGYDDPRWMTYRQAQEKGWQVREGEKGTAIEYWEYGKGMSAPKEGAEVSDDPVENENPRNARPRILHRVYTVFNAKQIDGIPDHRPKERTEFEVVQAGEAILDNSGATIRHDQNDRAFYSRFTDKIHLPPKSAFPSAAAYYGTALHELGHWTGHSSRLDRETLNSSKTFGDPSYAREELRAELASVFLAAERGIPHDPAQHAAYVGSWIKALQEDKNEIFRAARDAHKAADFVLSLEQAKLVDHVEERAEESEEQSIEMVAQREPASETKVMETSDPGSRSPLQGDSKSAAEPPVRETVLDDAIHARSQPTAKQLSASFVAAEAMTKAQLGEEARTFIAETTSGVYRGEIIGQTDLHVIQRLSNRTAIAHMKHLLDSVPGIGSEATIGYTRSAAAVREIPAREREKELSR